MKWYTFDPVKGSHQKRPPVYRQVLLRLPAEPENGNPEALVVGYRKNAAGDKQCPFFVIPGIGKTPIEWCDCLPEELAAALER